MTEPLAGSDSGSSVGAPVTRRIELTWPGKEKGEIPRQHADGHWYLETEPTVRQLFSLINLQKYPANFDGESSIVVCGDRHSAIRTLSKGLQQSVTLAYLDLPRIEVDDKLTAFRGDPVYAYSTWLTVLRAHLQAIEPLMRREGVVVVHTGDIEEPYARLVTEELFGRENRVATIVWQRAYGPRNMKNMKEFTATHDCLLVYAMDKTVLPPVGLRTEATGFANSDGDPRGAWKAEHKGAHSRRVKSDFNTFVPPYRWSIVEGELPPGLWRLNPLTGFIWGKPTECGVFSIAVEVTDSNGDSRRKKFNLQIEEQGTPPPFPAVPWLFEEIKTTGSLRVATTKLPTGVKDCEYSAIILGAGGVPHTASPKRPGSGRYWEFADDTLLLAYQRDSVSLGKNGDAIPHPKTYGEPGEETIVNQMTWWPGSVRNGAKPAAFAGYTEDATKHLKKMAELGLIKTVLNTGKPEYLIARLLDIFTRPGDVVLEVFGEAADLSAVAIKRGRRFVCLSGKTERQQELVRDCVVPRLRAVVDGKDSNLEQHDGEIRMRADSYVPYGGGGGFFTCELGPWVFERKLHEDFARMNSATFFSYDALREAILTSEGFLPVSESDGIDGRSFSGGAVAVIIPPDAYLDSLRAAAVATQIKSKHDRVVIFYFRAAEDFDETVLADGIVCRRIPSEITL